MPKFETMLGNEVPHCHVKPDPDFPCEERQFTRAERQVSREMLLDLFPDYLEVRAPSRKYNCHGYSFTHAHGWFNEPDLLISDDFSEVPMNEARRGDVLVYQDQDGEFTHSGLVKEITNGKITLLRSKMGKSLAVLHKPSRVDVSYGDPSFLLRRNRNNS